jgi:DNA repair protein RadA/Sms
MAAKKTATRSRRLRRPVSTKLRWLDQILNVAPKLGGGGGFVPGGVYMVVGGPGVGKSTMLMQAISGFVSERRRCLYICGDESAAAVGARLVRVNPTWMVGDVLMPSGMKKALGIDLVETTHPGYAAGGIRQEKPQLVIVDSVDVFRDPDPRVSKAAAGARQQVDNLMDICIQEARKIGAAIVFVFHTTKAGLVAGPKNATARVDCRIDLTGIRHADIDFDGGVDPGPGEYKHIRCSKNRFGPSNVERVLRMTPEGLFEV